MKTVPEDTVQHGNIAESRPSKFNVLGIGISALTLNSATNLIIDRAESGNKAYVCVTGVHGVSEAQNNKHIKQCHNKAWLATPDGMPLVWIGHWYYKHTVSRVYGPDLMSSICRETAGSNLGHFFYGGNDGVAEELAKTLSIQFPGLKVCGTYSPPFRALKDSEKADLKAHLEKTKPSFFWVGLSTPKQEIFMHEYLNELHATVMLGVGAAFDFHIGRIKQAPRWMQKSGLEWFYRLCSEPRRLGKRYLKNNPLFLFRIFLQFTGLRQYPLD